MVAEVEVQHTYKFPLEFVVDTHLTKYPTEKEKFVIEVKTLEQNCEDGIEFRKRIAICQNLVPQFMRKVSFLNADNIMLEEDAWMNCQARTFRVASKNVTWSKYANMSEKSTFAPHEENKEWTVFKQQGQVAVKVGFGPFSHLLEVFAKKVIEQGAHRSIKVMEEIMKEREEDYKKRLMSSPTVKKEVSFLETGKIMNRIPAKSEEQAECNGWTSSSSTL